MEISVFSLVLFYQGGPEHIHARSINEQSQVSRASRDPNLAFSRTLFKRLFVRVSLSSAVEHSSEAHRAGLSSDIARPSEAEQARAAISNAPANPSGFDPLRRARVFEFSRVSRFFQFSPVSSVFSKRPSKLERLFRAPWRR